MKYLLILALLMPQLASAHARLKANGNIPGRSNSAGIKIGPCGGIPRSANPRMFQAGATVTVDWEETINHPGRYEFYFSAANDSNWVLLKSVADTQDGGGLPHQYSTTITLPSTVCTSCTIQLIQVMTENPASPSLYYSCGDIQLTAGTPPTQPPPGGGPPPVEPPSTPCPDHQ